MTPYSGWVTTTSLLACLAVSACGSSTSDSADTLTSTGSARVPLNSVDFVLDPDGTSHIAFPFVEADWRVVTGSVCHDGDEKHADDWNWGTGNADEGKLAMAAAPGYVIFAGRKAAGASFDSFGNQVVVQVVDESGDLMEFAYRYAHLKSIAVEVDDYVHFGSEIGTAGGTGENDDSFSPHLHSVLYKDIYETSGSIRSGIENLKLGYSPSASVPCNKAKATIFAARFVNDASPYFNDEENLPCSTWNGDVQACNAHSIVFGNQFTQDCAYYVCSGLCLPRGTSNCRAGCEEDCNNRDDDSDESLSCHTWNRDVQACNARSIGNQETRDCAFYLDTDKCRPRGTSNCLAGIAGFCYP